MPDRQYTYRVIVDTSSARTQAAQIKRVFERELNTIQAQNVQLVNPAALRNVQTAIAQQTQAQQRAAQQVAQTQQTITAATAAQSQQRVAGAQSEAASRVRSAQSAADQMIAQERRVTQQTLDEQRNRQQQGGGGLGGGALGALKAGAAGFLTIQGVRLVANYATQAAKLDTQVRRTQKAFELMAGSVGQAESRLIAIQQAANGAVDRFTAMQIANQAAALKLAKTSEEFGNLARAAKLITFVSPTIKDINDALTQLSLFSSNEASFMRADQLGLSVREVKDRMAELRAENASLDGSTAKLLASIDILNQKYGPLLDSTEAQVSGVEKLNVAWAEFIQGASAVGGAFDRIAGAAAATVDELSVVFGTGNSRAILEVTKANAEVAKYAAESGIANALTAGGAERNAKAYEFLAGTLERLNDGVAKNIPTALEYRQQVEQIAVSADRWGVVTDSQLDQLREIRTQYGFAAQAAETYAQANAGVSEAQQRIAAAGEFGNTLAQFDNALRQLSTVQFGGIEGIADWRKELVDLRQEFLQTGTLADESAARFEFLSKAASANIAPSSAVGQAMQDLGTSFLQNNEAAAEYVQQMLDLNAAYANGKVTAEQYAAGLEQIQGGLQQAADTAQFNFNAALTRSTQAIAQLDQLIAAGTPGLTQWRDELTAIRDDMVSTGNVTDAQALRVDTLSVSIENITTKSADYGSAVRMLGDAFFATNDRATEIVEQLRNLDAAYASGAINADTYAASTNSLRNELDTLAINQTSISTEGIDQLGDAISDLEIAVARGLPGAENLINQAIALSEQIASSGGIVTADQAAQIDAWAAAADAAAISAETLAAVQAAVGVEVVTADGLIANMISSIGELTAQHNNGAISSETFAGAMNILIARLYELLIAAGLTKAEVDKLIASLNVIPNVSLTGAGGVLGTQLGETINKSLVAQEEARKRREAERLARLQESAAKRAANEWEQAMKKAAQEFETAIKNIPGLFSRSQVTERQLKLADAGVDQNFADDFLRRLQKEIESGEDIWPDVSIEQAREAMRKVGIQAVDDSQLAFEQLVEAWESGLLFSDKSNLELINAEAVKAALELQEKAKQGQQNIIDHFKNVIGIAVDASTGQLVPGTATGKQPVGANIPQQVEVIAPDEVQQVLTSGSITITSATLSAVALQTLAGQLEAQAFAISIDKLTISATATSGLSEELQTDVGGLKEQLERLLRPVVKPSVALVRADYDNEREILGQFLAPDIVPNIKLDNEDVQSANGIIAALTPNIHPDLVLTETEKTTFVDAVEALTPTVKAQLYAGATELSEFAYAVSIGITPAIPTTLYATIEELSLFKSMIETNVKPKVSVALQLTETTDEQGNAISAFPDIAGQFAAAVDKQISDAADRFTKQGKDIAGYIATAAYNYGFPDIVSRYATLIDFQVTAGEEKLNTLGTSFADAIAAGATTYVFPDVALQFVEAVEVQIRSNAERFQRQGTNAMNLITQGMNGFDFSFIATAMVSGVRAGIEQEAIQTALGEVGAGAMRTIRDGLENEAGSISWAGILTASITESVLTELADSLEAQ